MLLAHLEYQLQNGYIHNWLVAGPHATFVPDLDRFEGQDFKLQIARHYHQPDSGIAQPPAERDTFAVGDTTLTWRYIRCRDDHFVDLTAFYHTCHYLRSWAYAQLARPAAQEVTFVLTSNGPADLWLNGRHIHRQEHFHHQIPHSVAFQATLQEGRNEILVRLVEVAVRECPYAMALRIVDRSPAETPVLLPTLVEQPARRQLLERVFEVAYLNRDVYTRDDEVVVRWPDALREMASLTARLQTPSGSIFMEAWPIAQAGAAVSVAKGVQVPDGPYRIMLMPRPEEYYIGNVRVLREIPLWVHKNAYAQTPYGSYEERRREALEDATGREGSVFCEIARMELEQWSEVKTAVIVEAIEGINQRADCSDFSMVGLLGMMQRYLDEPPFPQELKGPLEDCVLNFKYWMDEPGSDAMCYWSENHQILFHACEILAGQLYPERIFSNAGQNGAWHRAKGERMALSWLRKRASGGFREWDSNCYFEEDILALAHLADLAEDDQVREFAAIVLDKLLFTMALNSYRGVFGSTHGRTYTPLIKGARLESTAGIGRLMWGMGVFNQHIRATVSLACAQGYELPSIIQDIAADQPEELWSRERHAGELEEWCDCASGAWEVNKVTYKTADYMLCSAQDYQAGQPGYQQHIWQATMSPDAVVFVTHPPCVSEEGSHRPNFWHGNVVLPRVAQWKDVLIAVHNLPDDDWMGFTHAYFPLYAFDEHALREGWAFARKGTGYLALSAAQGLTLTTQGDNAYRELRSYGQRNVWLCQMGRAARDGSFEQFQQAVLALGVHFDELSAQCATLRGETLAFGWEGPLLVNGGEQPISGFKHYENMYCVAELGAEQMEIGFGAQALRLNFAM
ncbi:MAG: hypothetical protein ACJ8CR_20155 [Roseiflexaceae bacterium]